MGLYLVWSLSGHVIVRFTDYYAGAILKKHLLPLTLVLPPE